MLRRASLLLIGASACSAGEVTVTVADCCDASCKGTIAKIDNPGTCPTPGDCKSGGSGTLNEDVTDAKMELTLTMGGIKILDKTVDACGPMNIPLPLSLGSVGVTALAGCPAKTGPIDVKIDIANKKAIPAKISAHSVTKDQDGNTLLCLDMTFTPVAAAPRPVDHDAARQQFIDQINAKQSLWKAGHNVRFRGTPIGVSKSLLGVKADHKQRLEALVARGAVQVVKASANWTAPSSFDSATAFPKCAKVINDIRDQSNCGCCWAFSAAESASDRLCTQTDGKIMVPLSAQDVCFCSSNDGCDGGFQGEAWDYVQSEGIVTGSQQQPDIASSPSDPFATGGFCSGFSLPHCHHHGPTGSDPYPAEGAKGCPSESSPMCPRKCDASAKAPHATFKADKYKVSGVANYANAAAMEEALVDAGSLAVSFTVYSDFENYAGGVYKHTGGSVLGGHAVRVVGFGVDGGQKYWKVANSWNPYWGEKGYFRIVRGEDECGIESSAVGSSKGASWTGNM